LFKNRFVQESLCSRIALFKYAQELEMHPATLAIRAADAPATGSECQPRRSGGGGQSREAMGRRCRSPAERFASGMKRPTTSACASRGDHALIERTSQEAFVVIDPSGKDGADVRAKRPQP
jgi:hypothetical protein